MKSVIFSIRCCISIMVFAILLWLVIELTREAPISLNFSFVSMFIDLSRSDCCSEWAVARSSWKLIVDIFLSKSSNLLNWLSMVDRRSEVIFAEESITVCWCFSVASSSWMRAWYVAFVALVNDWVDPRLWSSDALKRLLDGAVMLFCG